MGNFKDNPFVQSIVRFRALGVLGTVSLVVYAILEDRFVSWANSVIDNALASIVISPHTSVLDIVRPLLLVAGVGLFVALFIFAYLDTQKKLAIINTDKGPRGLSIIRVYDTLANGERSWILVFRNNEDEDLDLTMEINVGYVADFKNMERTAINLEQRFRGDWRVLPKKNDEREIARTVSKNDSFWFAPNGTERKVRGYYSFRLSLNGVRKTGSKSFVQRMDGYFVFRGGNDLRFLPELPGEAKG